jgi:hypothetical protein
VAVIVRASSLPGCAPRLAGESATHEVHCFEIRRANVSDIRESGHRGPVFFEDLFTELVSFDLPRALPSCALEAKIHSSNPGK